MKAILLWSLDRVRAAWAAVRPDAEATAAFRHALDEAAPVQPNQSVWARIAGRVAWLAAIALVGWVALMLR